MPKHRLFIKMTCLILASLSILLLFPACANETDNTGKETSTDKAAAGTGSEITDAESELTYEFPDLDFEGEEFTVLAQPVSVYDFYVDEMTGDNVDDSIYLRNLTVCENLNIEFYEDYSKSDPEILSEIEKAVKTQDDTYDLVSHHVISLGQVILKDCLRNWYELPYVDFENPWWSSSTVEDSTYNGIAFFAVGDYALTAMAYTFCMYFNKTLAEEYALGDIYQTVLNGEWTLGKLTELSKDIYSDLNGNSNADEDDFYGLSMRTGGTHTAAFQWAFDNPIMRRNSDGTLTLALNTEKMPEIVAQLNNLAHDNPGTYATSDRDTSYDIFMEERAVFCMGEVGNSLSYFGDMNDIGLIPYPKWNVEQTEYHTMSNGAHDVLAVPKSINTEAEMELTGAVTEALCAQTYMLVMPEYYSRALKYQGMKDEISSQILDMILDSRVFDFGFIYNSWSGAAFLMQELVAANNDNWASTWKRNERSYKRYYQNLFNFFDNYQP